MNTKKIVSLLLMTMFLPSCGKTTIKYNEPSLYPYKTLIDYEEYEQQNDESIKNFKILNDESFNDSFISTINIGSKIETSLLRTEKEYKNINKEVLRNVDAKYDNVSKAGSIDVIIEEKSEGSEIGDDGEDIISNSSTKSSINRKVQDELIDGKNQTYVIDDKNKSYELASDSDETSAYKYTASMCVLLIVFGSNISISYSPSLPDEEKAKFKFYSDDGILTQDYNDDISENELLINSTVVGTYKTNISFVTQYKVSEDALQIVILYKETTVNNYTIDYGSDYINGDKETITKESYLFGEIKLSKTSVSKSNIEGYRLVK